LAGRPLFEYFILAWQVEGTLFRVPKYGFEESPGVFSTVFKLPPNPENPNVEGSSDEHPFELHGISKIDFRSFLRVLYPW